jgi:hypothetical protein
MYQPATDRISDAGGLYEQTFRADQLVVQTNANDTLLGIAEVHADGGTIHGLLVNWPTDASATGDVYLEFNDQGNSCTGVDIESITATEVAFVVSLRPEADLVASRVSYVPEADMFSGPCVFQERRLGRIVAQWSVPPELRQDLRNALRHLASLGCNVVDELE